MKRPAHCGNCGNCGTLYVRFVCSKCEPVACKCCLEPVEERSGSGFKYWAHRFISNCPWLGYTLTRGEVIEVMEL